MEGVRVPLVSIIVPVYNTAVFLSECLESLKVQTYSNIEIILVDTGSTDASLDICEKFCQEDQRFKLFCSKNKGVAAGRNLGLENASGEFITFVDSDDWVSENFVKHLLFPLLNNSLLDFSLCSYVQWFSPTHILRKKVPRTRRINKIDMYKLVFSVGKIDEIGIGGGYVWNKMYRRRLLEGGFFPNTNIAEDEVFNLKIFHKATYGYFVSEYLYVYRMRSTSYVNHPSFPYEHIKMRQDLLESALMSSDYRTIAEAGLIRAVTLFCEKLIKNKTKLFTHNHYNLLQSSAKCCLTILSQTNYQNLLSQTQKSKKLLSFIVGCPYSLFLLYQKTHFEHFFFALLGLRRYFLKKLTKNHLNMKSTFCLDENFSQMQLNAIANTIKRVHKETFEEYRDCFLGRDFVIVASGETAKHYEPIEGAVHIGVNAAVNFTSIDFNYLFLQDYSGGKYYIDSFVARKEKCQIFYGQPVTKKLWDCIIPEVEYRIANAKRYYTTYPDHYFYQDIMTSGLADYRSVVFAALSFALWTHPKRIFLVCCDCSNVDYDGSVG